MKNFFNKALRIITAVLCAWECGKGCILVILRTAFGKIDRKITNSYLNKRAINILNLVKSNFRIIGAEKLSNNNQPRIYMSNHLSLFDTPLFYATIPDTIRIVTKKELIRVPLIGKAILKSEHAIVDRKAKGQNQDFYADAKRKLTNGISLWFFPEGTRSRSGKLQPFRMGGFRIAAEIGAQIIPVGLIGTDKILPAFNLLPILNQPTEIHIGDPIDASEFNTPELQQVLMKEVHGKIQALINSGSLHFTKPHQQA